MTYYHQIYRCRKCGNEFCPVTVHGEKAMLCELEYFQDKANGKVKLDWEAMPLAPRLAYLSEWGHRHWRFHRVPEGGASGKMKNRRLFIF